MKLTRAQFLRAVPLAAITPSIVKEGVARYDVSQPGHFIFFVDMQKVDILHLCEAGNDEHPMMPKGSKGGWIIGVNGDVEEAVKIFRLDDKLITEERELPAK